MAKNRSHLDLSKVKKIAFVRRNGLGDLLCAFSTVLFLRQHVKHAELTLFVSASNAPLLPYLPEVDKVRVFRSKGNKYIDALRLALGARKERYDVAISGKTSPMKLMNLFLFLLGAKKRIAFVDRSWHSLLINHRVIYDPKAASQKHQALKGLLMIAPHLKSVPLRYLPKLSIPQKMQETYQDEMRSLTAFGDQNAPLLLITASTTKLESRLFPARYAAIVNQLGKCASVRVIVVSEQVHKKRAYEIAKQLDVDHRVYFPRDFDAFMVLQGVIDLFFVGDGGLAHMCSALNKKGVVLFGRASPKQWKPLGERVVALGHPTDVNQIEEQKVVDALFSCIDNVKRADKAEVCT